MVLTLLIALGCSPANASIWAPHLEVLAPLFGLQPALAATVLASESTCRPRVVGKRGELGGFQILRGAATPGHTRYLDDESLMLPGVNTWLGLRRLAASKQKCGGSSSWWLGEYNTGECQWSDYAEKINRRLSRAQCWADPYPNPRCRSERKQWPRPRFLATR